MKNLLRCLALAILVLPTLALKAQPSTSPLEVACTRGGHCKISGNFCVVNPDCGPTGGICVCD
jgi:hypothetical protein